MTQQVCAAWTCWSAQVIQDSVGGLISVSDTHEQEYLSSLDTIFILVSLNYNLILQMFRLVSSWVCFFFLLRRWDAFKWSCETMKISIIHQLNLISTESDVMLKEQNVPVKWRIRLKVSLFQQTKILRRVQHKDEIFSSSKVLADGSMMEPRTNKIFRRSENLEKFLLVSSVDGTKHEGKVIVSGHKVHQREEETSGSFAA